MHVKNLPFCFVFHTIESLPFHDFVKKDLHGVLA